MTSVRSDFLFFLLPEAGRCSASSPEILGVCLSSESRHCLILPPPVACGLSAWMESRLRGGMGFPPGPRDSRTVLPAEAPCGLPPTELGVRGQSPCPVPGLLAGCCLTLTPPVDVFIPAHLLCPLKGSHLFLVLCRGWTAHVLCLLGGQVPLGVGPMRWFCQPAPQLWWAVASCAGGCRSPDSPADAALLAPARCFSHLNNPGFVKEIVPDSLCLSVSFSCLSCILKKI